MSETVFIGERDRRIGLVVGHTNSGIYIESVMHGHIGFTIWKISARDALNLAVALVDAAEKMQE